MYSSARSPISKSIFGIALAVTLLVVAVKAWSLFQGFRAGAIPSTKDVGTFSLFALLCPLYLNAITLNAKPNERTDLDAPNTQIYEEQLAYRLLNLCVMWSVSVGMFISTVTSDYEPGDLFSLLGPIFFVGIAILGAMALLRRTYRVRLSPAGLDLSFVKNGPVAWSDIRDVKLIERFRTHQIVVTVSDTTRYGLRKAELRISPMILRVAPERLQQEIQKYKNEYSAQPAV